METKLTLKAFKRQIDDFRRHLRYLRTCDYAAWDGRVGALKAFLNATPAIGDQVFKASKSAPEDFREKIFNAQGAGMAATYNPPPDEDERMAILAKILLEGCADEIRGLAWKINYTRGSLSGAFEFGRDEIMVELFDVLEERVERKYEDLAEEISDPNTTLSLNQVLIFGGNVAIANGGGDATANSGGNVSSVKVEGDVGGHVAVNGAGATGDVANVSVKIESAEELVAEIRKIIDQLGQEDGPEAGQAKTALESALMRGSKFEVAGDVEKAVTAKPSLKEKLKALAAAVSANVAATALVEGIKLYFLGN